MAIQSIHILYKDHILGLELKLCVVKIALIVLNIQKVHNVSLKSTSHR